MSIVGALLVNYQASLTQGLLSSSSAEVSSLNIDSELTFFSIIQPKIMSILRQQAKCFTTVMKAVAHETTAYSNFKKFNVDYNYNY